MTIPVYARASRLKTLAKAKLDKSLIMDSGIKTIAAIGMLTKALNSALLVNLVDAPTDYAT